MTSLATRLRLKTIQRFDRYAVLLKSGSREILLYKHAIAGITEVPTDPVRP